MIRVGLINVKSAPAEGSVDSQSLTEAQKKCKSSQLIFLSPVTLTFLLCDVIVSPMIPLRRRIVIVWQLVRAEELEGGQFEQSGLNLVIQNHRATMWSKSFVICIVLLVLFSWDHQCLKLPEGRKY